MYSMTGSGTTYRRDRSLFRISRTLVLETSFCGASTLVIAKSDRSGERAKTYSDHLGNDMNVVLVVLEARQGLVDVGAGSLDDEGAELPQDVIQIRRGPYTGCAHCLDQVRSGEQCDTHGLLVAMDILAAANDLVDLVVEVVEDLGSGEVLGLNGLPRVAGQPLRGLLRGVGAHLNSVFGGGQAGLLVGIGHWRQEAADDFILCVEASVVGGHLEHAQVEIGYGAVETAAFVSNVALTWRHRGRQ